MESGGAVNMSQTNNQTNKQRKKNENENEGKGGEGMVKRDKTKGRG